MAAAAAPLALAATGLSAGSKVIAGGTAASNDRTQAVNSLLQGQNDILQGQEAQALHNFKATNLDIDATYGQAKASETDAFMRDQLVSTLANISAVRASANVAGNSPTGAAIENRVEEQSDTARQQRIANINAQIATDRSGAAMERAAGISAMSMARVNSAMEQANAATDEQKAKTARLTGDLGGFGGLLSGISGALKA